LRAATICCAKAALEDNNKANRAGRNSIGGNPSTTEDQKSRK
jgi:hypothetical protein